MLWSLLHKQGKRGSEKSCDYARSHGQWGPEGDWDPGSYTRAQSSGHFPIAQGELCCVRHQLLLTKPMAPIPDCTSEPLEKLWKYRPLDASPDPLNQHHPWGEQYNVLCVCVVGVGKRVGPVVYIFNKPPRWFLLFVSSLSSHQWLEMALNSHGYLRLCALSYSVSSSLTLFSLFYLLDLSHFQGLGQFLHGFVASAILAMPIPISRCSPRFQIEVRGGEWEGGSPARACYMSVPWVSVFPHVIMRTIRVDAEVMIIIPNLKRA